MENEQPDVLQTPDQFQDAIVGLCTDSWRFSRVYLRVLSKLDAVEQKKYQGQFHYYLKQIDDRLQSLGLKIVNLEGQQFDPGFPVNILNINDFCSEEHIIIDQMLEPVIMGPAGVLKMGTCLVKRG